MNRFTIIIYGLLILQSCSSQTRISKESSKCTIDKDSALQIAFNNGYERGLDSIKATYVNDSIWRFECYLCNENNTQQSNTMDINCLTGKVEPTNLVSVSMQQYIGGRPRVYSEFPIDLDQKPVLKLKSKPHLLTDFDSGREANVTISNKNIIAFSYGFRKIGIINIDGSGFKQISDESLNPQWVNDDVIAYFKDFEHVYEYNINTMKETKITTEANAYYDFSVSPDNKWLAYLKDAPHIQYDSNGNAIGSVHTCSSPREVDLWVMNISNPTIQKKINTINADIYDPIWTEKGDSLLFYIGDKKYCATKMEKNKVTCSQLNKLSDIKLTNYKRMKNGIFPAIKDCKIVLADYNKRTVTDILVNERSRYSECVFSNDRQYLIYTKSEKYAGDTKIWILNLTK